MQYSSNADHVAQHKALAGCTDGCLCRKFAVVRDSRAIKLATHKFPNLIRAGVIEEVWQDELIIGTKSERSCWSTADYELIDWLEFVELYIFVEEELKEGQGGLFPYGFVLNKV